MAPPSASRLGDAIQECDNEASAEPVHLLLTMSAKHSVGYYKSIPRFILSPHRQDLVSYFLLITLNCSSDRRSTRMYFKRLEKGEEFQGPWR